MKWINKVGLWWIILIHGLFSLETSPKPSAYNVNYSKIPSLKKTLMVATVGFLSQGSKASDLSGDSLADFNRILTNMYINIDTKGNNKITLSSETFENFMKNYKSAFETSSTLNPNNCEFVNIDILDAQFGQSTNKFTQDQGCKINLVPKFYGFINGATKIPCLNPMELKDWKIISGTKSTNLVHPEADNDMATSCFSKGVMNAGNSGNNKCTKINGPTDFLDLKLVGSDIYNGVLCYPNTATIDSDDFCVIQLEGITGDKAYLNGDQCLTFGGENPRVRQGNLLIKNFNNNKLNINVLTNNDAIEYVGRATNNRLIVDAQDATVTFNSNEGLAAVAKEGTLSYSVNIDDGLIKKVISSKGTSMVSLNENDFRLKIDQDNIVLSSKDKQVLTKNRVPILDSEGEAFLNFVINNHLEITYNDILTKSITAKGLVDYFYNDIKLKVLLESLSAKLNIPQDQLVQTDWKAFLKDFKANSMSSSADEKFNYFLTRFTNLKFRSQIKSNQEFTLFGKQLTLPKAQFIELVKVFSVTFGDDNLLLSHRFIQEITNLKSGTITKNSCKDYKMASNLLNLVRLYSNNMDASLKLAKDTRDGLFPSSLKNHRLFKKFVHLSNSDLVLSDKSLSSYIYENLKYELICSATPSTNTFYFSNFNLMEFIYKEVIATFYNSPLNLVIFKDNSIISINEELSNFYLAKLKNNQINVLTGKVDDTLLFNDQDQKPTVNVNLPQNRLEAFFSGLEMPTSFVIDQKNIREDIVKGMTNLKTALNSLRGVEDVHGVVLTTLFVEKVLQFVKTLSIDTLSNSYTVNEYQFNRGEYGINHLSGSSESRIRLISKFPTLERIFDLLTPLIYQCKSQFINFDEDNFFNSLLDNVICNLENADPATIENNGYQLFNQMSKLLKTLFPNGEDLDSFPEINQDFLKFIVILRDLNLDKASMKAMEVVFEMLENSLPFIMKMDQYFITQPHIKPYIRDIQYLALELNEYGQNYLNNQRNFLNNSYTHYLYNTYLKAQLNRDDLTTWMPAYVSSVPSKDISDRIIGTPALKSWNALLSFIAQEAFFKQESFLELSADDKWIMFESKFFSDNNSTTYGLNVLNGQNFITGIELYSQTNTALQLNEIFDKLGDGSLQGRQLFLAGGFAKIVKGIGSNVAKFIGNKVSILGDKPQAIVECLGALSKATNSFVVTLSAINYNTKPTDPEEIKKIENQKMDSVNKFSEATKKCDNSASKIFFEMAQVSDVIKQINSVIKENINELIDNLDEENSNIKIKFISEGLNKAIMFLGNQYEFWIPQSFIAMSLLPLKFKDFIDLYFSEESKRLLAVAGGDQAMTEYDLTLMPKNYLNFMGTYGFNSLINENMELSSNTEGSYCFSSDKSEVFGNGTIKITKLLVMLIASYIAIASSASTINNLEIIVRKLLDFLNMKKITIAELGKIKTYMDYQHRSQGPQISLAHLISLSLGLYGFCLVNGLNDCQNVNFDTAWNLFIVQIVFSGVNIVLNDRNIVYAMQKSMGEEAAKKNMCYKYTDGMFKLLNGVSDMVLFSTSIALATTQ
jgi:hypothetical protein